MISFEEFSLGAVVMTNSKPKKNRKLKEAEAVEVHPDAWERFESTVKTIVPPKGTGANRSNKDNSQCDGSSEG